MKKIVFAFAAVMMGGAATFAATAPALAETRSVAVETAGYDLGSSTGFATVARRIERAADRLCDTRSRDLGIAAEEAECRDAAIAGGMRQLHRRVGRVTVTS